MDSTEHEDGSIEAGFKDKKVGLLVFGIILIIMGGLCGLLVPMMVLGVIASRVSGAEGAGVGVGQMVLAILMYAGLAGWFITMGIGSIKARRWARALILTSSWMWLVMGVSGFIFMMMFMPGMYEKMAENGDIPHNVAMIMKTVMMIFMLFVYVIVPGAFVLFYGGRHIKATCKLHDPTRRWTDGCPLPVLALSILSLVWSASMLMMGCYRWTMPFFGTIISGLPGAMIALSVCSIFAYCAWGTFKLDVKAWWCMLVFIAVWFISAIVTFPRIDMLTLYEKMGMSEQQLQSIGMVGETMFGPSMLIMMGVTFIGRSF